MVKAEIELQRDHEDKGQFALRSCQSRTPVDLAVFTKKGVVFFQIKQTVRDKIFVGNEIKKLDQLDQNINSLSAIAVKFVQKDTSTWVYCPVHCLIKNNLVTVSKDEKCCIKKEVR